MKTYLLSLLLAGSFACAATAQPTSWQSTSGPGGGTFDLSYLNPQTGQMTLQSRWTRLKGNGSGGNLFKLGDNQSVWQEIGIGLHGHSLYAITGRPGTAALVVATRDTIKDEALTTSNIYYSANNGQTWQKRNSTTFSGVNRPMALLYNKTADTLWAARRYTGMYYSVGSTGVVWTPLNGGIFNKSVQCMAYGINGLLYCGTDTVNGNRSRLYRRGTGNWVVSDINLPQDPIVSISYSPVLGTMFCVTTNTSTSTSVISQSTNGITWTPVSSYPGHATRAVRISVAGNLIVSTSTQGVWEYDGSTWTDRSYNLPSLRIQTVEVDKNGSIIASNHFGMWKLADGATNWVFLNGGGLQHTAQVRDMAFDPQGNLVAATDNGIYRIAAGGSSWTHQQLRDTICQSASYYPGQNELLIGTFGNPNSRVYRSADGGLTWINSSTGIASSRALDFAYNSTGDVYLGGGWGKPLHTSSDAMTWTGHTWSAMGLAKKTVAIGVAINSSDDVFIGTELAGVVRCSGGNFPCDAFSSFTGGDVTDVAITAAPDEFVFAAHALKNEAAGHIYASYDNGNSWSNDLLPNTAFFNCILTIGTDSIYAGGTRGVWFSSDQGQSWSAINMGLNPQNMVIQSLKLGPDGRLYAGTSGDGVYRSTAPVSKQTAVPQQSVLNQTQMPIAFPNPTDGLIQLRGLSGGETITVSDLTGRTVGQPTLNSGNSAEIDLTPYGSGLYLITIASDSSRVTLRAVVR